MFFFSISRVFVIVSGIGSFVFVRNIVMDDRIRKMQMRKKIQGEITEELEELKQSSGPSSSSSTQ